MTQRIFLAFLSVTLISCQAIGQVEIHLSCNGHDSAAGTPQDPLRTIQGARDYIRELRVDGKLVDRSVDVLLHAGRYENSSTIEFTVEDSGTPQYPIKYKSIDGEVIVSGGLELQGWQKVTQAELLDRIPRTAHDHILCMDISKLNITSGITKPRCLHQEMHPSSMELHVSGKRLPKAGWPNEGWAYVKTNSESGEKRFVSKEENAWILDRAVDVRDQKNVWAHGFWNHDWADSFMPVQIDSSGNLAKLVSIGKDSDTSIRNGARYRLSNLLSELDMPGEWYLDEPSQTLVYWPQESFTNTPVTVSIVDTLLSIYDTENLVFEDIRFESARSMVIEIAGGKNIELRRCEITQAGNVAVHVFHGSNHKIEECDISCTGSSAVRIEGGDRKTLTASENTLEKCHVHTFCLDYLAGRPGVAIYGVGNIVRENHIHEGPDSAICLFGNDHLIESNRISHVCRESDDTAAIHLSYDPTYRGNIIRKNFIHDLGGFSKTGVFGIYLDDFASGTVVSENFLSNTVRGIVIGGGRDNLIEKNIIEGALASIQIDARGTTWAKDHVKSENSRIQTLCKTTLDESPIYAEKYSELKTFLADEPWLPKGNVIRSNSYDSQIGIDLQGIDPRLVVLEANTRSSTKDIAENSLWSARDSSPLLD